MRVFSALSSLLLAGAVMAQSSACAPNSTDVQTLQFAWALQYLSERFWTSQPLNDTFLRGASNASRANYEANFRGITRENRLGVRAVRQLGSSVPGFSAPHCNFTFPPAPDANSFVRDALQIEQTVAGGLIGLAAYTRAPEVSFLLARLAAQHGAQASYIGSETNSTYFHANSHSLFPAYTPNQILLSGNHTGHLGTYLRDCVSAPPGPCGQTVNIGPLVGTLNATGVGGGGAGGATGGATGILSTPGAHSPTIFPTGIPTARNRKYY